jgi:hypothetical protein
VKRPLACVYLAVTPSLVRVPVSPVRSMPLVRRRLVREANWLLVMEMEITGASVLSQLLKSRFPPEMAEKKGKSRSRSFATLRMTNGGVGVCAGFCCGAWDILKLPDEH